MHRMNRHAAAGCLLHTEEGACAGNGGRMHMNNMMRSGSAANSQMTGPGSGGSAGQHLRAYDNPDQPFGSFP